MKKIVKYGIALVLLVLVLFNSVYFRKLNEVRAAGNTSFNADKYARNFFNKELTPYLDNAVPIDSLLVMIENNKQETFAKYSNALGIGNIRYFLIKGQGTIAAINENDMIVSIDGKNKNSVQLETEFIFGNAIRDASGLIDINEFTNTMDFNNVSAELNEIVRSEVLPPFIKKAAMGDTISFHGAIELNQEHLNLNDIEVIPIRLNVEGK